MLMTLHLRENGDAMPTADDQPLDPAQHGAWQDSTLDLRRGLEVVELPVETVHHDGELAGAQRTLSR